MLNTQSLLTIVPLEWCAVQWKNVFLLLQFRWLWGALHGCARDAAYSQLVWALAQNISSFCTLYCERSVGLASFQISWCTCFTSLWELVHCTHKYTLNDTWRESESIHVVPNANIRHCDRFGMVFYLFTSSSSVFPPTFSCVLIEKCIKGGDNPANSISICSVFSPFAFTSNWNRHPTKLKDLFLHSTIKTATWSPRYGFYFNIFFFSFPLSELKRFNSVFYCKVVTEMHSILGMQIK